GRAQGIYVEPCLAPWAALRHDPPRKLTACHGSDSGARIRLDCECSAIDRRANAVSQTRFINPTTLGKPPGYTHVVEVTAPARIVYIAGQLGIDKEGKLSSDFRSEERRVGKECRYRWSPDR